MKLYKWVYKDMTTGHGEELTHWKVGRVNVAEGEGGLCTNGVLHAYRSKEEAEIYGYIHTRRVDSILIEVEANDIVEDDGVKVGTRVQIMTSIVGDRMFSLEYLVLIGIKMSLLNPVHEEYKIWAEKWISGVDRTAESARLAQDTTTYAANTPAFTATNAAVYYATQCDCPLYTLYTHTYAAYAASSYAASYAVSTTSTDSSTSHRDKLFKVIKELK